MYNYWIISADITFIIISASTSECKVILTLNLPREKVLTNLDAKIKKSIFNSFKKLLHRREKKEPIAYIINNKEFWKNNFYINKDVLIPRPETEIIVEEVLKIYLHEPGVIQFLLKNVYWKSKEQLAFRFNLTSLTENNSEVGEALPSFTHYNGSTLFLKGEKSDYIRLSDQSTIEAHFSSATVATISNAGHWLHAENPEQFIKEVLNFLL